jgi:RNA polymerase sigma-70 factor (ECF subfamily)
VVLGFDAGQVGAAFAVPGPAMAQRLVRAKRRIKDAGIPFAVPDRSRMPERLASVLEAVYGCYALDWRTTSAPTVRESMAAEARHLAVTLTTLLPEEPEVWGLAALISLSLARADVGPGAFVPLDEQDTTRWSRPLIEAGDAQLRRAAAVRRGPVGRFELEAAIQSAHAERAVTGTVDWAAVRTLYAALVEVAPTLGSRVALAAATGRVDGPRAGLAVLDGIEDPALSRFQPAWATRAALLADAGDRAAAATYEKAISLSTDPAVRAWLRAQADRQAGGHSSASSA